MENKFNIEDDKILDEVHKRYSCPRCGGMGMHCDGGENVDCNYPERNEERIAFEDGAKWMLENILSFKYEIPDFKLADKVHDYLLNTEDWCTRTHKGQIRDTVTATLKQLNHE